MINENLGKRFEFKATPTFEMFYDENSMWGAYSVEVDREIPEALISMSDVFGQFEDRKIKTTLVGKTQQLILGNEYDVVATLTYSNKHARYSYEIISVTTKVPKSREEQSIFLQSVLTELQAETILDVYPDIVNEVVEGRETVDLSLLYGIGEKRWEDIKNKILENFVMSDLLVLLAPLGVTLANIKKIFNMETNPQVMKEKFLKNPYVITEIRGISFTKADKIALSLAPELIDSRFRLMAFIDNYLDNNGDDLGHTWVKLSLLKHEVKANVPQCLPILKEIIEEEKQEPKDFYIDGDRIGRMYHRFIEEEILRFLNEIKDSEPIEISEEEIESGIRIAEEKQGFVFTEEQKDILRKMTQSNFSMITGKAGCVDADTEFFNGNQWKKISEYKNGDYVLQYNKDGSAELVNPERYIKEKEDYLWHFETKYGLDQMLSDEHNVYYITSRDNLYHKTMKEVVENHNGSKNGFQGRFITSFSYDGKGMDYDDTTIRLMVASIADGSYNYNLSENAKTYTKCRFHLKKEEKKKRLISLLEKSSCDWYHRDSSVDGYDDYYVILPERIKEFSFNWYNASQKQLFVIADELQYWDASYGENNLPRIFTSSKTNADFIQFVYSSIGYRASILKQDRTGQEYYTNDKIYVRRSIDYVVHVTKRNLVGMTSSHENEKIEIKKKKTTDGYKYCFTVPSGMLVLRRNDKIFITGNSGKTTLLRGIMTIYGNYTINACALSAKASKRIEEATGFTSSTIHRLLGAKGENTFDFNKYNKLPKSVIVVDEASMVNAQIFYNLLSAVEMGSKVIFCGDAKQLPPIGFGNVFSDLLERNEFQINSLTKILRQAEKSGIIKDANQIREGISPIDSFETKIVHGENEDMFYMFRDNKFKMRRIAINMFLKSVEEVGVDNVFILTPRKDNVTNSSLEINKKIQDILLGDEFIDSIESGKRIFKNGCKVIHRVNNYDKGIFNGEIGYIRSIKRNSAGEGVGAVVEYDDGKFIEYTKKELAEIDYAYALTTHLYQGSEAHTIIGIIDKSHYIMLDTTFLYTMVTRAKERCLLVAEPYAFDRCLKNNKSIDRQTWLKEL